MMLKIKGMKNLFRERYEFKVTIRKFLSLGLEMSLRFLSEANEYYQKIFKLADTDNDGQISFLEFKRVIKTVDATRADWKIHALFQKATGSELENATLGFNGFIKCAINNVLMQNMIDWEKALAV